MMFYSHNLTCVVFTFVALNYVALTYVALIDVTSAFLNFDCAFVYVNFND